jgi:hypothetical protein
MVILKILGRKYRIGWYRRSQTALLLIVFTLNCQMTGESPSESVWRRSERTPVTAPVINIKMALKNIIAEKEIPIPDAQKPQPAEEKIKPAPIEPVVEIPEKEIVEEPEKQGVVEPEKAIPAQKQPVKPEPTAEEDKPAIVHRPDVTREIIATEESLLVEITGLIIEQTMTRIGYDFYEYFFLLWEQPQVAQISDYNIYINERASPLWGSWVWVSVNDTVVWQNLLKPRAAEVEDAAKQAIAATKQFLTNFDTFKFESEDMIGTGI